MSEDNHGNSPSNDCGPGASLEQKAGTWCVAVQPRNHGSKNVFLYDAQLGHRKARDIYLGAEDARSRYFPTEGESNFVLAGCLDDVLSRIAQYGCGIQAKDVVAQNALAVAVADYAGLARSLHLGCLPRYDENEPWD